MVADGGLLFIDHGDITGGAVTALNGGTVTLVAERSQGGTITALNGGLVNLSLGFRAEGETVTAMTGGRSSCQQVRRSLVGL